MKKSSSRRARPGRPPSGPGGQKVSQYPQLTVRLPAETKAKLNTLSLLTGHPIWKLLDQAVEAYVQNMPEPERSRLGAIAERLVRGDWPVTSHWAAAWSTAKPAARPGAKGRSAARR
ncbi:MAG TPA: hypothetical protein VFK20_15390 [Vicinamibacterales bacterium]|nr:hypothetical protein [Vicinamibacterales bacterium]